MLHKSVQKKYDRDGTNILDEDWDTLIILDCARYDVFSNIIDIPGDIEKKQSLASITANFVERNFKKRQAHDVIYLSANAVVGSEIDYLDVHKFVGMWNSEDQVGRAGQGSNKGLMDPGPIVKRSLKLHEKFPKKRHIVHILSPHTPHRYKDGEPLSIESPYRNYNAARDKEIDKDVMRNVYSENLSIVLDEIKPLVTQLEGKVVITADHGEILGETPPLWMKLCHTRWGNKLSKYDFGHYSHFDVKELREVPWFILPHDRRREIETDTPRDYKYNEEGIKQNLEALGYL